MTAAFFPFAVFSPEWQAIRHALEAGVPVRFIDLGVGFQLARGRAPSASGCSRSLRRRAWPSRRATPKPPKPTTRGGTRRGTRPTSRPRSAPTPSASSPAPPASPTASAGGTASSSPAAPPPTSSRPSARRWSPSATELPDEDPLNEFREAAMRREIRAAETRGPRADRRRLRCVARPRPARSAAGDAMTIVSSSNCRARSRPHRPGCRGPTAASPPSPATAPGSNRPAGTSTCGRAASRCR